ncbi:helix-turn-helix domain-containing protein [Dellaglioa algida]|uniref:helix-turn-helix domain-containing protein n=1 Tax=Dellaglioa algida TaxID=105612 RepID=UPI0024C4CBAF|nr:helix-turn-helix transcriptional regulator [Dellaglioa algida]MDK1716381.1 helix-turn-helix transcriptional regulator [Dellaglioa algida]MDK1720265.1 helix-turn-helix transcriptional regulator [Dellaglioa algida]MDK1721322.1 helix-turn-helix transcriptional regulator [Dellaglioa algida]
MMIDIRLRVLLAERRITATQLSKMTGLSRNTISLIVTGKSKGIAFNTLDKIMMALEIDDISQLIQYVPTEEKRKGGKNPN